MWGGATMKFGIVGAGAMGCLLGSFLTRAGKDVWLVDVWEDHVCRLREHGLTVDAHGKSDTVPVHATTDPRDVGICDVVIISTKFRHTRTAISNALSMIDGSTRVMTIQNGIGNVETISEFVDREQIVFGLTTLGSVLKEPGKIEATFSDEAITYLWTLSEAPDDRTRALIETFRQAGLDFHLTPDVRERIWRKLCLNAGLSLPLAIPRLKCGDFIDQPSSQDLVRNLVSEIAVVAHMEGVAIDAEEAYEYVVTLAKQAPDHLTSALVDVLNQRKTEIDCLNAAIVAKANQHHIEVPYNTAIVQIIRIIENTYDKRIQHL
jgi:2-dehydropantoate 2-reductase